MNLEPHRLAGLIPEMSDEDYDRLRDSVRDNGLLDPITVYEGKILDGRHRYRACMETSTPIKVENYVDDQPVQYVISRNLDRRHLTPGQRGMVAAKLLPDLEAEARDRQKRLGRKLGGRPSTPIGAEGRREGISTEIAGALVGTSGRTVVRAKRVLNESPELAQEVMNGTKSIHKAEGELFPTAKATRDNDLLRHRVGRENMPLEGKRLTDAKAAHRRMSLVLGKFQTLSGGLPHFPLERALLVATEQDLRDWRYELKAARKALSDFEKRLANDTTNQKESTNGS